MSAGFMGASFRQSDRAYDRGGALAPGPKAVAAHCAADQDLKFCEDPSRTVTGRTEIIAKLVQTRAQHLVVRA